MLCIDYMPYSYRPDRDPGVVYVLVSCVVLRQHNTCHLASTLNPHNYNMPACLRPVYVAIQWVQQPLQLSLANYV